MAAGVIKVSQELRDYVHGFGEYSGPGDWEISRELMGEHDGVISTFNNIKDVTPKQQIFGFCRLPDALLKHQEINNKADGPLFSMVAYKLGATRSVAGTESVYGLVYDDDDVQGGFDVQLLMGAIPGVPMIVYSSHSHTPEKPKYRVVVFLAWPIPARFYKEVWTLIGALFPLKSDPAPSSSASIFYLPACRPGAERVMLTQGIHEGRVTEAPFDWITFLQSAEVKPADPFKLPALTKSHIYETPSAAYIAKRCPVIREAYETGGAEDSEPLWFGVLKCCAAMEPDISVDVSDQHPKFTVDDLVARMERIEREGLKPTTCQYFSSLTDACSSCKWRGLIRSPMALGYEHLPAKSKQGVPA